MHEEESWPTSKQTCDVSWVYYCTLRLTFFTELVLLHLGIIKMFNFLPRNYHFYIDHYLQWSEYGSNKDGKAIASDSRYHDFK